MWRWFRAILKQFPKELTKFDDKWFFGVLLAVVGGLIAYNRMGKERFMSEYLPAVGSALVGAGLMVAFLVVRSAYSIFKEVDDRATNAEKMLAELTEKPHVEVLIKEAFIIPKRDQVAECFVRLLLQNKSSIPCSPTDYTLGLRIKGLEYEHTSPLRLKDYKLGYGKVQTLYDDVGAAYEAWGVVSSEELPGITDGPTLISLGEPIEGWIAIAVHNLPEWDQNVESIGTYSHAEYDDDGNVIAEYPTDVCETILHLNGVENLRMVITDSFNQAWPQETSGPFESKTKRILPHKVDAEERAHGLFTRIRE